VGMPQYFSIVAISGREPAGGELATAVATMLFPSRSGIQPSCAAAAVDTSCRLELIELLVERGLQAHRADLPGTLDPRSVDLWVALDSEGEALARRLVSEHGPAPDGFYRRLFPEPIVQFGSCLPQLPEASQLDAWLASLDSLLEPWRERLWAAFRESS
jgi:hypothetical protein